jgi:phosphoglycerate dehydrogenase-like enzyme
MSGFRIAMTADMRSPSGESAYPMVDLSPLSSLPGVELCYVPVPDDRIARAEHLATVDALILCECGIAAQSFPANRRLGHIARFGVGFDDIAIDAATEASVLVTNAPLGLRRPMAVAVLLLVFALANKLFEKSRIARKGPDGWSRIADYLGLGLIGRTLGSVGLGSIGSEVMRLAHPFGFKLLAHDPFVDPRHAASLETELVGMDELCRRSDFLSINCPLSRRTEGLLTAGSIALMKPSSYLINTSRGKIVDQQALTDALTSRKIAGAALDVFETEPLPANDPLNNLDNVILTPHAIGLTDQCFADTGKTNVDAILTMLKGGIPANVLNPQVLEKSEFQQRLLQYCQSWAG